MSRFDYNSIISLRLNKLNLQSGTGVCLLVILLGAHAVAYAQIPPLYTSENTPETTATNDRLRQQQSLQTVIPAKKGDSSDTPQKVIEMADKLKSEGKLQQAAFEFRRAAELGKDNPEIKQRAVSELNFHIPVIIAQQQAIAGKHANAKKILEAAAARNRQHPARVRKLTAMLNAIALLSNSDSDSSPLDGKSVMKSVTRILKRYQRQSGHFPITKDELMRVLPPNQFPLIHFSIQSYRGNTFGFSLELKSNSDPENKIYSQQTGLVE